jgi:UDP-N-acetylglucosamine 2-epimerase
MEITQQFAERLSARGYDRNTIVELFSAAAKRLDNHTKTAKETRATNDTIYLHWTWHPRDVNRTKLRAIYNGILKERSDFTNLIVAYSRPKNLRDCLMKTQLSEPAGNRVSALLPPPPQQLH